MVFSGLIVCGKSGNRPRVQFNARRVVIDVLAHDDQPIELPQLSDSEAMRLNLRPGRRYVWLDNEFHLPWRQYDEVRYFDAKTQPLVLLNRAGWYLREWVQARSKNLWQALSRVPHQDRFHRLSYWSVKYVRYHLLENVHIDDQRSTATLRDWYHKQLMRAFRVLGLPSSVLDVVNREPDPWDVYLKLLTAPWRVMYVDESIYLWLVRCLGLKVPDDEYRTRLGLAGPYQWVRDHGRIPIDDIYARWPNVRYLTSELGKFGLVNHWDTLIDTTSLSLERELISELDRRCRACRRWRLEPSDHLNSQQRQALELVSQNRVSCIVGPAGTGKTTLVKTMRDFVVTDDVGVNNDVGVTNERPCRLLLTSFTGKACRRLSEVCQVPAQTIHLLLYKRPSEVDLVVVDEVSMVSPSLLLRLLKRLPVDVRLVFVGDFAQLPPIGEPSLQRLLSDLQLPTVELTECLRSNHVIFDNCQQLRLHNDGEVVFQWTDQFVHRRLLTDQPVAELVADWSTHRDYHDFKVITPYREAAETLNSNFNEVLSSIGQCESVVDCWGTRWLLGEKVMFTFNDADYSLSNGDEGVITSIADEHIIVRFEPLVNDDDVIERVYSLETTGDRYVGYYEGLKIASLNTSMIMKSSAITVHKAQGSEWSEVWFYLPYWSSFITRRLVYTALTRARDRVVIYSSMTRDELVSRLSCSD